MKYSRNSAINNYSLSISNEFIPWFNLDLQPLLALFKQQLLVVMELNRRRVP